MLYKNVFMNRSKILLLQLIALWFSLANSSSIAQDLQLTSRYDYYTHEDTTTLILFGKKLDQVAQLIINGQTMQPNDTGKSRWLFTFPIKNITEGEHRTEATALLQNGKSIPLRFIIKKIPQIHSPLK